jgi:hypothetical protein
MVGIKAAEYEYGCATRSRTAEGRQKSVPGKERRSARARRAGTEKQETVGNKIGVIDRKWENGRANLPRRKERGWSHTGALRTALDECVGRA